MRNRASFLVPAALMAVVIGCEQPQARFELTERTKDLMSPARTAVADAVEENFGTPNDLVAWLRFPIRYGVHPGHVAGGDGTVSADSFPAEFDEPVASDLSGAALRFTSGKYQGQQVPVGQFDADAGQLVLGAVLDPPVEQDTQFQVVGDVLQHGRMLYMTHCMHCHGVSGDGEGPTAQYLNPRPRDYRLGIYKFTSTKQTDKASTDDLQRTVKQGIPGTYMPSFMLLKDDELAAVVEYVRFLSIRGEFEKKLVDELYGDYSTAAVNDRLESGESEDEIESQLTAYIQDDLPSTVDFASSDLASSWTNADTEAAVVVPEKSRVPDTLESRKRGRALYVSDRTKCVTCHGPKGRGNGSATNDYWKVPGSNETYDSRGLHDLWGNKLSPRDLTRGIYGGGRRPIDRYRRVYAGIKGTPMPAFGGTVLKDDEIWDLVNYVMSIPFESEQPSPGNEQLAVTVSDQPR